MTIRVGINGFGRIGRSFERVLLDRSATIGIEVVALNEPNADAETLAFLLEHDSIAGALGMDVETTERGMRVGGQEIAVTHCLEPAEIPWADHEVDAAHVVVAALHGLAQRGEINAEIVAAAIDRYGIDTDALDPRDA